LYDVEYHGAAFTFKYHPEYGVDGKMNRPKGKRNRLIFNGMKLTRSIINARATIDYSFEHSKRADDKDESSNVDLVELCRARQILSLGECHVAGDRPE
jgi:hypothetical protein